MNGAQGLHDGAALADVRRVLVSYWLLAGCLLLALPTAVAPEGALAGPTYLLGLASVVVALWRASRLALGAARAPWRLMACAASCWLAGDVAQRALVLAGSGGDTVGLPDVFWLSSYPLLAASVVRMVRARGLSADLCREIALDVLVVSSAAGIWAWHLLVAPSFVGSGAVSEKVAGALYPLGDVGALALALTLLMAPGRRGVPVRLLIGCLGLTLPLDVLQTVLPDLASSFDPVRLDGALLVVNGFLAAAALHPDRDSIARRVRAVNHGHGVHRWRVVLLGFSLCSASAANVLPGRGPADLAASLLATLVLTLTVVVRFYLVVREREAAEARLRHAATHDLLTGAANRHLLMERLAATSEDFDGTGPVLVFLDLDGFKAVNDALGHAAGDEVLRAVAGRLRRLFRETDTVARIGGDEFVVLAHGLGPVEAEALGDRVRAAVVVPVPLPGTEARVGASVGVLTALPAQALDADDLLRRADAAMYEAKRDGSGVRTRMALA